MLGFLAFLAWTEACYGDGRRSRNTAHGLTAPTAQEFNKAVLDAWNRGLAEGQPAMLKELLDPDRP